MKIGILTMNYTSNYGGILQCVALQRILESYKHEVFVIRYSESKKSKIKKSFKNFANIDSWHILYHKFRNIIKPQKRESISLIKHCRDFIKSNINYTELCDEDTIGPLIERLNLDIVIIGSDKVWGAMADHKLIYFGEWHPAFKGKLCSYAACTSRSEIPSFNKKKIIYYINKFNYLSVRDKHTYNLLQPYTKTTIKQVLDPTFLYDFKEYIEKDKKISPYILTYILGEEIQGGHKKALDKIKTKCGNIPVISIIIGNKYNNIIQYSDKIIDDASPLDWINLIKNACFVYTDSFHGTVFSLKYQKLFVTFYKEKYRASRLISLKEDYNIPYNIVESVDQINVTKLYEIDFNKVQCRINENKIKSLDFIESILSDENVIAKK